MVFRVTARELISRSEDKLDTLVAQLAESGITAEGFPADVSDLPALTEALTQAARHGRPVGDLRHLTF